MVGSSLPSVSVVAVLVDLKAAPECPPWGSSESGFAFPRCCTMENGQDIRIRGTVRLLKHSHNFETFFRLFLPKAVPYNLCAVILGY